MGIKLALSINDLHPAIRIICLLIVSIFVVSAKPIYLIVTLFLLLVGFSLGTREQLVGCGRVLLRLKWLFISIFLIYLFLTPGRDVFLFLFSDTLPFGGYLNALLKDLISIEGVYLGLLRVSSLVILIMTVNLFIQAKKNNELSYAIIWLLSPFRYLGFQVDRLAIRISLTLKYVNEFQQTLIIKPSRESAPAMAENNTQVSTEKMAFSRKEKFQASIESAIEKSVGLVESVLTRVNEAPLEPINRPPELVPRYYQWLFPISLLSGYLSL